MMGRRAGAVLALASLLLEACSAAQEPASEEEQATTLAVRTNAFGRVAIPPGIPVRAGALVVAKERPAPIAPTPDFCRPRSYVAKMRSGTCHALGSGIAYWEGASLYAGATDPGVRSAYCVYTWVARKGTAPDLRGLASDPNIESIEPNCDGSQPAIQTPVGIPPHHAGMPLCGNCAVTDGSAVYGSLPADRIANYARTFSVIDRTSRAFVPSVTIPAGRQVFVVPANMGGGYRYVDLGVAVRVP